MVVVVLVVMMMVIMMVVIMVVMMVVMVTVLVVMVVIFPPLGFLLQVINLAVVGAPQGSKAAPAGDRTISELPGGCSSRL